MAKFQGDMDDFNFTSLITDYYKDYLEDDEYGPPQGEGYIADYVGTFNYSNDSQMNESTFLGGVVHAYVYTDFVDNIEYSRSSISSFSLDYSEFQQANFDKDTLLAKILSGNDVLISEGTVNGYDGNDTIYGSGNGGEGNDSLHSGMGADFMIGGTGNDTFYVNDRMDRIVENADEGYDKAVSSVTFSLKGTDVEALALSGSDAVGAVGNTLANKLVGNDAGNKMQGLEGNDALYGGLGRDALYGGSGNDSFVFDTALGTNNLDVIYDFAKVTGDHDTIRLDHTVFAALTQTGRLTDEAFALIGSATATVSGDAHILYNASNGALYYDADGGDASGRLEFAVLSNHAALTHQDFLVI